ncbi:hypothetical protein VTK73DRAFT_1030 [Phialemonium thermophilum]|uniref:Uncharacterized protein n=1 Tax=Phialemonium thermophilum TaxID=223376 RepID=A0ABR3VTZ4_9PEZI
MGVPAQAEHGAERRSRGNRGANGNQQKEERKPKTGKTKGHARVASWQEKHDAQGRPDRWRHPFPFVHTHGRLDDRKARGRKRSRAKTTPSLPPLSHVWSIERTAEEVRDDRWWKKGQVPAVVPNLNEQQPTLPPARPPPFFFSFFLFPFSFFPFSFVWLCPSPLPRSTAPTLGPTA